MKQPHQPLRISIPKPCSENWNSMQPSEKGRFCASCKKEVIDFSGFTAKELYYYFNTVKTIPCGRFHQSQLNSGILPKQIKPRSWSHLYKRVAAVLAFLSLRPSGTAAQENQQTVIQPIARKTGEETTDANVTITGTVKNWQSVSLEKAEVYFEGKLAATSDKEGKFSFDVPGAPNSKISTLTISYPKMVSVIRNYHPAMQSTSYDVVMRLQAEETYPTFFAGGISFEYLDLQAIDISFSKRSTSLQKSCENDLAQLAVTLRNHPNLSIQFIGFGNTAQEINLIKKRQQAIKSHLEEKEGIAGERLKIKIKPKQVGKSNTIEISAHND